MTRSGAEKLIDLYRYGFWVSTKQAPRRVVRWDAPLRDDGRASYHGKNWVEVLPHGVSREPERFYTADVEYVSPAEWLDYYPGVTEPICGWGRPRLPDGKMQYCPRLREAGEPWCAKHKHEMDTEEERNLENDHEPGAGGEPVSAPE